MQDEFAGMGGSYELMPDGTKRLRERTAHEQPAPDAQSAEPEAPAATDGDVIQGE